MNKVSILIPCYNGSKYIDRCMNSILDQTYNSIQVIVINDGSTDNSKEEIMKYTDAFNRKKYTLTYKEKENGGAASAIKLGLKLVDTEYFMLLDIDDYIYPYAVEKLAEFLNKNIEYNIVRGNGYFVSENDLEKINGEFIRSNEEKIKKDIFEDLIYAKTYNWAGSYMVRSKSYMQILQNIGYFESKYGQNLQILLPMSYKKKVGYVDVLVMKYINSKESFTNIDNFDKRIELFEGICNIRLEILKRLNALNKEYEKYLQIECLRMILTLCYEYKNKYMSNIIFGEIKLLSKLSKSDIVVYLCTQSKIIDKIYGAINLKRKR